MTNGETFNAGWRMGPPTAPGYYWVRFKTSGDKRVLEFKQKEDGSLYYQSSSLLVHADIFRDMITHHQAIKTPDDPFI